MEYKARLQEELSAMSAQERKQGGMDKEEWQASSRSGGRQSPILGAKKGRAVKR